jgi:hypothetical protein
MKITVDLKLLNNKEFATLLQTLIYYLGLFQCIFLIIPLDWYLVLNYRFIFIDPSAIAGLLVFLLLPGTFVLLINKFFEKKLYNADDRIINAEMLDKKEGKILFIVAYTLLVVSLVQFLIYSNYISVGGFEFLLLNISQFLSLIIATVSAKKIQIPEKNDKGPIVAGVIIGLIALLSYFSLATLFLGIAILMVVYISIIALQTEILIKNQPEFQYKFQESELEQFGWVKNDLNKKCLPVTFGWFITILWIVSFSSFMGAMMKYSDFDGSATFGYLILIFMVSVVVGERISELKIPWGTDNGKLRVLIVVGLLVINLIFSESIPILRNSAFDMILNGLATGILLSMKIRFRRFNEAAEPTLMYGFPLAIFWTTFFGLGSTLIVSDDAFNYLSIRLALHVFFLVFAGFLALFEIFRFKKITNSGGVSSPKSVSKPPKEKKVKPKKIKEVKPKTDAKEKVKKQKPSPKDIEKRKKRKEAEIKKMKELEALVFNEEEAEAKAANDFLESKVEPPKPKREKPEKPQKPKVIKGPQWVDSSVDDKEVYNLDNYEEDMKITGMESREVDDSTKRDLMDELKQKADDLDGKTPEEDSPKIKINIAQPMKIEIQKEEPEYLTPEFIDVIEPEKIFDDDDDEEEDN